MHKVWTDKEILDSTLRFTTRGAWAKACPKEYLAAYRRGKLPPIYTTLAPDPKGPTPSCTEEEIINHAKQFKTQVEWDKADTEARNLGVPSKYAMARKKGTEFVRKCCAHMGRAPHTQPLKYTDEQIKEVAKKYSTRKDFKKGPDKALYSTGIRRHKAESEFWKRITAHMEASINPYHDKCYVIYAIEFASKHAYVGLSSDFDTRLKNHKNTGPVAKFIRSNPEDPYTHRFLEENLYQEEASAREGPWQLRQQVEGWRPLWNLKNRPGSLGSIPKLHTFSEILEKAKSYTSRSQFQIENSGMVRFAKHKGWYEEIMLVLPHNREAAREQQRKLAARPVSDATRAKQSASAVAKFARGVVPAGNGKLVVVVSGVGLGNGLLAEQMAAARSLELVDKGNWIADARRLGDLSGAVMVAANADKLVPRLLGAGYQVELIRGPLSHINPKVAKNARWATNRAARIVAQRVQLGSPS